MSKKVSKVSPRFLLTRRELKALQLLGHCTFAVGSYDKRFVRSMQTAIEATEKQRAFLQHLVYRYRRQLRMSDNVARAVVSKMKFEADRIATDTDLLLQDALF